MATLGDLPDLEQASASFRLAYANELLTKINRNPQLDASDSAERPEAGWANFLDNVAAVLQDDFAERRVSGIVRLGDSRIYRVTADPEGSQVGSVGDLALRSDNGSAYLKVTGEATNTGWQVIAGTGFQAGGWAEVVSCDFEAGPSVDLASGTNPTVTVDGVLWTGNNNDATPSTAMGSVTSFSTTGSGLVLQGASASTNMSNTAHNAPHVWTTWAELLGRDPRPGHAYCLQVRVRGNTPAANTAFGVACYTENDGAGDPDESPTVDEKRLWAAIENVAGTERISCREGSTDLGWRALPTAGSPANDVIALIMWSGVMATAAIGDWSSGFPSPGDMARMGKTWLGAQLGFSSSEYLNPNDRIALFFQQQLGSTFNAEICNFRVLERG